MATEPVSITEFLQVGRGDRATTQIGPVTLSYTANFSAASSLRFDFSVVRNTQQFGVPKAMFVDNSSSPNEVEVLVSGTDQFFTVPPRAQGTFTLDANIQSTITLTTDGGASDLVSISFYNHERMPCVWYRFGAFNNDQPIQAYGTMEEGSSIVGNTDRNPLFVGGRDPSGNFVGVRVDALGRLDFASTISIGGVFGADPMGAAPVNPGVVIAVLDGAGDISYLQLNADGEIKTHDEQVLLAIQALDTAAAPATGSTRANVASVDIAGGDVQLRAAATCKFLMFYNDSDEVMYIASGATTVTVTSFALQIGPQTGYEVPAELRNLEWRAGWSNASGFCRVTTGT